MNTDTFINQMVTGDIKFFKVVTISDVTYMFQDENSYNIFMESKIYEWSDNIPKKAIKKFNDDGFKVVFISEDIDHQDHISDGTFIFALEEKGKKANSLVCEIDTNASVLYHEFGHYIDVMLGEEKWSYSNDLAFKAIILLEGTYFGTCFAMDYLDHGMLRDKAEEHKRELYAQVTYFLESKEYFAQAFAIYMTNRKLLYRFCPETYKYIDSVYKSLF